MRFALLLLAGVWLAVAEASAVGVAGGTVGVGVLQEAKTKANNKETIKNRFRIDRSFPH